MSIMMNGVAREEHIPHIERQIRTLKEQCRGTYNILTFKKRWPMRLVIELVYDINFCLHIYPKIDGISSNLSPR